MYGLSKAVIGTQKQVGGGGVCLFLFLLRAVIYQLFLERIWAFFFFYFLRKNKVLGIFFL